jgi:hypothetical protein
MPRTLTVLFRRDPSRDRQREQIRFEGYQVFWPDGRPVAVGLNAFCTHGQRLLGLGRHLRDRTERRLELSCYPLRGREDHLTRIPGLRIRRFLLQRTGGLGRIHFIDGTPTDAVFDLGRDEARVLNWIGLSSLADGEGQWFDLAARPVDDVPAPAPVHPPVAADVLHGLLTGFSAG